MNALTGLANKGALLQLEKVILFFMAVVFLGAMNYVNNNVGGSGIQLPYNAFTWSIIALAVFVIMLSVVIRRRLFLTKAYFLYLLSVGFIFFPLIYNDRLLLDTTYLVFVGLGAGLFFLGALFQCKTESFKSNLLVILFVSTIIQTFWGLSQYYLITESNMMFLRASLGLPYGVFQQTNDYSSFLSVGSLMALYYLFSSKKITAAPLVLCLLLLFLNHHLMILAKVTTVLVVSVVSILVFLGYFNYRQKRYGVSLAVIAAIALALVIPREFIYERPSVAAASPLVENVKEAIDESKAQEKLDDSLIDAEVELEPDAQGEKPFLDLSFLGTRQTIYKIAAIMIMDEPIVGHGVGSFGRKYLEYQARYLEAHPNAPAEFYLAHAHSEPLHWMVELGAFSVIGFVMLLLVFLVLTKRRDLDLGVLMLGMPLALHSLFELPFYHSAPHFLFFLCILFLADKSKLIEIKVPRLIGWGLVPVAGFGLFMAFVFLYSTIYACLMFHQYYASDKKDLAALTSIKNPAAFRVRYNYEFMHSIIAEAGRVGSISAEDAKKYMYWAYSVIQYAPQESIYENFIVVLRLYGNVQASLKYAKEAHFLYPKNETFPKQIADLEFALKGAQ